MTEALYAVVMALGGTGVLLPWRRELPAGALLWLGVPTGAAIYLLVSLGMLVVADRVAALAALAATGAIGGVGTAAAWRRGQLTRIRVVTMAGVAAWAFLVALLAWVLPLARLTIDSGEYLTGAGQLVTSGASESMGPLLLKRQMGYQALHALSAVGTRAYVAWVGPLFGVSLVGLLSWLAWSSTVASRRWRIAVIGGLIAFVVSSSRFFYDFFYIHPHIHMASMLLVAVLGSWMAITRDAPGWAAAAGLALAATLLLRPESPLLVAVVLVAVAATPAARLVRRLIAVPSLFVMVFWYGAVLWRHAPGGDAIGITEPVSSSLVIVVGSAIALLVAEPHRRLPLNRWVGMALVPGVVAVLVIYAIFEPILLRDSVVATFRNLKRVGWWGTTWAVLVPLAAAALLTTRVRLANLWSRVVVSFGLLFFIFPHLRGSPWRIGPGDSGNRMLAHFLPVVLAFVLLSFGGERDAPAEGAERRSLP